MTFIIFWSNLKHYAAVTWTWIKKYWFLFLIAIVLILSSIFMATKQKQVAALLSMLKAQSDQHSKDLEEMQRIHEEEIKQREALQKQYDDVIAKINEQHAKAMADLAKQKETEMKALIQQFGDDPARMASEMSSLLGFEVKLS